MKNLLFITMLLGAGYSQCGDMNGDSDNNILDIVILANCVLDGSCALPHRTAENTPETTQNELVKHDKK